MQFKNVLVLALPVFAVPTPAEQSHGEAAEIVARGESLTYDASLEKREIITAVVTSVAIAVGTQIAMDAANAGAKLIKDIANWNNAREQFTKATTKAMWDKNPDAKKYPAAICNNVGYTFTDPKKVTGTVKVNLKQGALKTDYDCMYMEAGNTFKSTGDGGYINIAIMSDSNRCKFNKGTLTC